MVNGLTDTRLRAHVNFLRNNFDKVATSRLERTVVEVLGLIPPDIFRTSYWDALAEDACASVAYAYRCKITAEPQEAVWAALRSYEAVDQFYICVSEIELDSEDNENKILSSDVVQRELTRQDRDLTFAEYGNTQKLLDLVLTEDILDKSDYS